MDSGGDGGGARWGSGVSARGRSPAWVGEVAPVFLGTHTPRLDDKGRLFLPAKFRDELADGRGDHQGPGALPLRLPRRRVRSGWPTSCGRRRSPARRPATTCGSSSSGASDEVPDKQGRDHDPAGAAQVRRPRPRLRVIGAGTRVEIWDAAAWETYLAEQEQAFADQAEEVVPGLF